MSKSINIYDELGRKRARLRQNSYKPYFSLTQAKNILIFLGVSANLEEMQDLAKGFTKIYWLESPDLLNQMTWQTPQHSIFFPTHWQKLSAKTFLEKLPEFLNTATILIHKQNDQLFSRYWKPLLSTLELLTLNQTSNKLSSEHIYNDSILLPGTTSDLLTQELYEACIKLGLTAINILPANNLTDILYSKPKLFLSVNLRGLDPEGKVFHLLQAAQIPTAIWFVDNPWHNLSLLSLPWWQEAAIFVSDASFIPELKAHGAKRVFFLPLGAWMQPVTTPDLHLKTLTFVGRSTFPGHNSFFAGLNFTANYPENSIPSVHYWQKFYQIHQCWPGKTYRQAGFAAEKCSLAKRINWLTTANNLGLTLFGNKEWETLIPDLTDLRQPLDYYTNLAHVYTQANFNLNLTSHLLPEGLTQRHFDVFAAGGFLLTDFTPGLKIFPDTLTQPIIVNTPQELASKINFFQKNQQYKLELIQAWQAELSLKHMYEHRLTTIITTLEI